MKTIMIVVMVCSLLIVGGTAFGASGRTDPQVWIGGLYGSFVQTPGEPNPTGHSCFISLQPAGWDLFEASWLIGHEVLDTQEGYLGQISGFVIDNTNGRIVLVVLSDVRNLGEKVMAIPYSSLMRTGEDTFEFNPGDMTISDMTNLTQASSPSRLYGIPSEITTEWASSLYTHYGQEPYWMGKGEQPPVDLELYQSTALLGAEVQIPKKEEVANIDDLLIDSVDGHIVFVVLSNIPGRGQTLVAVPYCDLSKTSENVLVINTTRSQLASAPGFDESKDLGNLTFAENVYKYFGLHPYWLENEGKSHMGQ